MTALGISKRQEFYNRERIGVELMPLLHSRRGGKMHTFVVQLEQ